MRLELSKYRRNKIAIEMMLKKELNHKDIIKQISEISVALNVPVLAVCIFVTEIIGDKPEILQAIEMLKKFYKYDEVIE